MAKPKVGTTSNPVDLNMKKVEELGLSPDLTGELKRLKFITVGSIVDAMRQHGGDFTLISDPAVEIIDADESALIGDAVLLYEHCPQDVKDAYDLSKVTPHIVLGEPTDEAEPVPAKSKLTLPPWAKDVKNWLINH